ncbi:MAG: DUF4255 domain-containing protein [Spirosomataceae bacterium]
MILHALTVIANELNNFLNTIDGTNHNDDEVKLGNIALLESPTGTSNNTIRDKVIISLVNLREEKTLKNLPFSRANDTTLRTEYFNPPVNANLFLLFSSTANDYAKALKYLSRIVRFFQSNNIFTHLNTAEIVDATLADYDRMGEFKLIMDLYSPSFEELNHLWGTLGGKQYPSVLYMLRMVELKNNVTVEGGGIIQEIQRDYKHIITK